MVTRSLGALFCVSIILSLPTAAMSRLDSSSVHSSHTLGKIGLYHDRNNYFVKHNDSYHKVEDHATDKTLRSIKKQDLNRFLANGYITVNRDSTGEFNLKSNGRVKGGGVIGAWIGSVAGYGLVTGVGHGGIHLVAICTGPFYMGTAGALHKMLAIPIHKAACAAGVAGGIALGVATGPA